MTRSLLVTTRSPEETRILGAALAPTLLPGDVISLSGDLGAGKTTFVQGLASALGVSERVTSPSFMIVHEYNGRYPIVHVDVYRLNSLQEVLDLGFEELLDASGIMLIEWGQAITPLLPGRHLEVVLRQSVDLDALNERDVYLIPFGDEWARKLDGMRRTAEALLDAASPDPSAGPRLVESRYPPARDDRTANRSDEEP